MTPELRRLLERKAARIEAKLGILETAKAARTASEQQAAILRQVRDDYEAMNRAPRRPVGRSRAEMSDWQRERADESASRRPSGRKLTTTERQLIGAGMLADPNVDPNDDVDDDEEGDDDE